MENIEQKIFQKQQEINKTKQDLEQTEQDIEKYQEQLNQAVETLGTLTEDEKKEIKSKFQQAADIPHEEEQKDKVGDIIAFIRKTAGEKTAVKAATLLMPILVLLSACKKQEVKSKIPEKQAAQTETAPKPTPEEQQAKLEIKINEQTQKINEDVVTTHNMSPEFLDDTNWARLSLQEKIDLLKKQLKPYFDHAFYEPDRSYCKEIKDQNLNKLENYSMKAVISAIDGELLKDPEYYRLWRFAKPNNEKNVNLHRDYLLLLTKIINTYKQKFAALIQGKTEISTEQEKEVWVKEMEQLKKNFQRSRNRLILRDSALKNIVERDKILKELGAEQKKYGIGSSVNNFLYSMEQSPVLMREMPKLIEQEAERLNTKLAELGIDIRVNSFELFGNIMAEGLEKVLAKNNDQAMENINAFGYLGIDSYISRLIEEALDPATSKELLEKHNIDIIKNDPKGTIIKIMRAKGEEVTPLVDELLIKMPKVIRDADKNKDKMLCALTPDVLLDKIYSKSRGYGVGRYKNESGERYLTFRSLKFQEQALSAAATLYAVYKVEVAEDLAKQGIKMQELSEAEQFALTAMKFNSSISRTKKTIKDFAQTPEKNSLLNPEYIKKHVRSSTAYKNVVKRVFGSLNAIKAGFFHKKGQEESMQKDLAEWEKGFKKAT